MDKYEYGLIFVDDNSKADKVKRFSNPIHLHEAIILDNECYHVVTVMHSPMYLSSYEAEFGGSGRIENKSTTLLRLEHLCAVSEYTPPKMETDILGGATDAAIVKEMDGLCGDHLPHKLIGLWITIRDHVLEDLKEEANDSA